MSTPHRTPVAAPPAPRGRRCLVVTCLLTSHAALFGLGYHWHRALSGYQAHRLHDDLQAGAHLHPGTPVVDLGDVTHAGHGGLAPVTAGDKDATGGGGIGVHAYPPPPFPPPQAVSTVPDAVTGAAAGGDVAQVEEEEEEDSSEETELDWEESDESEDSDDTLTDDAGLLPILPGTRVTTKAAAAGEQKPAVEEATKSGGTAVPAVAGAPGVPGRVVDLGSGSSAAWIDALKASGVAQPGDTVIYTWTNFHMRDFLASFLIALHSHHLTGYVIGALDDELAAYLGEYVPGHPDLLAGAVVPVLKLNAGLTKADYGWNSPAFKKMARYKFESVLRLLEAGFHVCVADTDTAWLRNPLPLFDSLTAGDQGSDILISTDVLRRMPLREQVHSTLNIGVMLFRATPPCVAFVRAFFDEMVGDAHFGTDRAEWDQARFNRMARDGGIKYGPAGTDYILAWQGRVKLQALDILDFPNGHVFFVQRLPQQLGRVPYIGHATFQYGGTAGKRHRFREALVWLADEREYYAPQGGLLAYDFVPDPALVAVGNTSVDAHFALMNPQLSALRSAWGLAKALGRTLVLPTFLCGMDRAWFPHDGVFPGSDPAFTIPWAPCPADHVLDVEALDKMGEMAKLREWSLLNNTRLPAATLSGAAWVDWQPELPPAEAAVHPVVEEDGTVLLPRRIKSTAVRALLAHVKAIPLLRFRSMPGTGADSAFAGFDDDKEAKEFVQVLTAAPAFWCCIDETRAKARGQPFPPGQTWYDLQWDLGAHTDRFNRKWGDEGWSIKLGP